MKRTGDRPLSELAGLAGRGETILAARPAIFAALCLLMACLAVTACGRSPQARTERAARPAPSWSDSDRDGIPDAAELRSFDDRANFRRWLTSIAEMQFYQVSEAWNVEQRDCAGLVRFAWREALRRHDRAWFQRMGAGYEAIAPDVRAYSLERGPLGEKLFRTDFGAFQESDLAQADLANDGLAQNEGAKSAAGGKFSEFADARTLKNYNAVLISRDRRQAQAGDLVFFHQPWVQKYPYHVMLFLGEARHAAEGASDWVVYHTGASPTDEGTIKKVRLAVLDHHPDPRWRPVETNRNFLGFYRLKILE
jgi:uncharacterized protein YfaT (DUF1175 family)